jgi:methionyl-tRNA synthetase
MSGDDDKVKPSWGNIDENHWTRTRGERNKDSIDYYRERSNAPGVAEGGELRNHYCMECKGVIPLDYDRRKAASGPAEHCPHCGVELDPRVREMFNWVEIDQPPDSDLRALVPLFLAVAAALGGIIALLVWLL